MQFIDLRPAGTRVRIPARGKLGSRANTVGGEVVGWALLATHRRMRLGYAVRLDEGCDTKSGLYLREVVVDPDDLMLEDSVNKRERP